MTSFVTIMEVGAREGSGLFRRESFPIDSNETVAQLKSRVGEKFEKQTTPFHLMYLGKVLDDTANLDTVGVNNGSTVLLYPKLEKTQSLPSDVQSNREKISMSIKALIRRKALHLVATADLQMQICRSLPHVDVSTFALIHNERLLRHWATDKNTKMLDKLSENYPYLGDVLLRAVALVKQKDKIEPRTPGSVYLVDGLSSDSDEDEVHLPSNQAAGPSRTNPRRAITEQMLQAALQATFTEQSQVATQTFGPQLQTMREMGITDERACIQALVRTGGDVDMAINLFFMD